MKHSILVISVLASALILSACGSKVPTDIVDQNQSISRNNAQFNATRYGNIRSPDSQIIMQSDSTISPDCRFGDGWASGEVFTKGRKTEDVKCQTNGRGKGLEGCLTKAEFVTKDYRNEEGSCQNLSAMEKFSTTANAQ